VLDKVSHFHPSLILVGKIMSLPEQSTYGWWSSLARKIRLGWYWLLVVLYLNNYSGKKVLVQIRERLIEPGIKHSKIFAQGVVTKNNSFVTFPPESLGRIRLLRSNFWHQRNRLWFFGARAAPVPRVRSISTHKEPGEPYVWNKDSIIYYIYCIQLLLKLSTAATDQ